MKCNFRIIVLMVEVGMAYMGHHIFIVFAIS